MLRLQLPAVGTLHTAHPMPGSISGVDMVKLAHGRPELMTKISGCKWILAKNWRWQQYRPRDDTTLINGSWATLFPTATTAKPSIPIRITRYMKPNETRDKSKAGSYVKVRNSVASMKKKKTAPCKVIPIPEFGIRNPESRALESGLQLKVSRILLTIGIRNPWVPVTRNPDSTSWIPAWIQFCLVLPYIGRNETPPFIKHPSPSEEKERELCTIHVNMFCYYWHWYV